MTVADPHRIRADAIRAVLLAMAADAPPGRGVAPDAVARALIGTDEKLWRRLMAPIRDEARRLAAAGVIILLRKGRPIAPGELRGLYRIRLRAEGEPLPTPRRAGDDDDPFPDGDA